MNDRWRPVAAVVLAAAVTCAVAVGLGAADPRASATAPPTTTNVSGSTAPDDTADAANAGERTITVNGHGTVTVTPDVADVSVGVQITAPTASEAMATLGDKSTALVDTLTGVGLPAEDVQTSGLTLWPTYDDDGTTVEGYQAGTSLTVTVRDVARIGEILDAAQGFVGEGLVINGIAFSYADPEAVLGEARAAAVDQARVRAGQYAAAAGVELGDVVRLVESGAVVPVDFRAAGEDVAAAQSVAIEPGSQELGVDVTVVFAMA